MPDFDGGRKPDFAAIIAFFTGVPSDRIGRWLAGESYPKLGDRGDGAAFASDQLEALRATIALSGLITPAQWRGLVDGDRVNPVPVSLCRARREGRTSPRSGT